MDSTLWSERDALDRLRSPWQFLFDQCPEAPVFLSWEWTSTWWNHFGAHGTLHVFTLTEEDQIVAIAPGMRQQTTFRFIGSAQTTDYAGILAAPGREEEAATAFLRHLENQCQAGHEAELEPLPEGSPLLASLGQLHRAPGMGVWAERVDTCPVVELPESWDAYLATLDRVDRHEIRRKMRRAQSAGHLALEAATTPEGVASDLPQFYLLHQSSPDRRKAEFLQPNMQAFFTDACLALAERGWARLSAMRLDDISIAAALSFDRGHTVALYNSGFDPAYRALSPGIVLTALEIEAAITRGHRVYDFLRGNERYKYDFGATDRSVYRLHVGASTQEAGSHASDGSLG